MVLGFGRPEHGREGQACSRRGKLAELGSVWIVGAHMDSS